MMRLSPSASLFPYTTLFRSPHAVLAEDLFLGIGDERKRQAVFLRECLVRLDIVGRDTDHHDAGVLKAAIIVAQAAGLFGATRRVIFGIEVERNLLTAVIRQRNGRTVLRLTGEIRCSSAGFGHHSGGHESSG